METLRIGPGVPRPPRWRVYLAELRTVLVGAAVNFAYGLAGGVVVWAAFALLT